jgi:hypothetical protein
MPKSCIICRAVASPVLELQYCSVCQSALYCSKACQKIDWRRQHKPICKLLNVGHGDMQVRNDDHTRRSVAAKEHFEREKRSLGEGGKRFFKLFGESTFEGSRAAARKMMKFAKGQSRGNQEFLLFHSLSYLVRSSDSEMLSWPNNPLLVLLQFVDPNVLSGDEDKPLPAGKTRITPLHMLADQADPSDYSTHENQVILARQLIEHGANVNAVTIPGGRTPLHNACCMLNVTNLDFVELLLEAGSDPNSQDHAGTTPLMWSTTAAPGAAKFLLNWPSTDTNITTRSGASFLAIVRQTVEYFFVNISLPDNPDRVQDQFLLQQWREIEEMLVERGAHDTGITAIE